MRELALPSLSDKTGRRNNMLASGALVSLSTVPLLTAISTVQNPITVFMLIVLALATISFYTSISGLVKVELFPMEVRARLLQLHP